MRNTGCSVCTQPITPRVHPLGGNHRPESRMRETRLSGSEGGGTEPNRSSLPLSIATGPARNCHCHFGRWSAADPGMRLETAAVGSSRTAVWLRSRFDRAPNALYKGRYHDQQATHRIRPGQIQGRPWQGAKVPGSDPFPIQNHIEGVQPADLAADSGPGLNAGQAT